MLLMHAHWLHYQSAAQKHWWTGLHQQGYRQQTEQQRNLGIQHRSMASAFEKATREVAEIFAQHNEAANNPKYAGPFSNWETDDGS